MWDFFAWTRSPWWRFNCMLAPVALICLRLPRIVLLHVSFSFHGYSTIDFAVIQFYFNFRFKFVKIILFCWWMWVKQVFKIIKNLILTHIRRTQTGISNRFLYLEVMWRLRTFISALQWKLGDLLFLYNSSCLCGVNTVDSIICFGYFLP